MFYGLARQGQLPKAFGYVHPKYRVPIYGTITCFLLMFVCTIYICAQGGTAEIMNMFINIVCVAWLGCYILAMVDVLVLRKRYPDFPRLFKVPAPKVTFTIGIIGSIYAIYTISDYILFTLAWLAVVVIFIIVWNKAHKKPINEVTKLEDAVIMIRERTEYLPVWDEAVVDWLKSRNAL